MTVAATVLFSDESDVGCVDGSPSDSAHVHWTATSELLALARGRATTATATPGLIMGAVQALQEVLG